MKTLDPEPGMGCTFYVALPTQRKPRTDDDKIDSPLIFAIEDGSGITLLYERYLTPEGYRFEACNNPEQAVTEVTRLQPQLLLLDLRQPTKDIFNTVRALRDNILTRDIPIILCSSHSIDTIEDPALEAGVHDLMQKPILRQELVATVQRWVQPANPLS